MNSSYIADSVFKVKLNYEQMQNKTEELFFRCLEEERDPEYFAEQIEKIWGNVDHAYMEDEIERYREIIHTRITGKEETLVKNDNDLFALVPIAVLLGVEKLFKRDKIREYKYSERYIVKLDDKEQKDEYIKIKLGKYTNGTVVYKSHTEGADRLVPPSVYNSMIYNTNLTRSGWNQTMEDADKVGANYFMIPYHSFSCPHCISHQERLLTRREIIDIAGRADESEGDILHPNCKCEITIWDRNLKIPKSSLTESEKDEASEIRQKVNGLTLKKERIRTKMKIAEENGYMDVYDKYNQQRNKINKSIRDLKEQLPTKELKKQVTAINR
jgi:hypothetical protein